MRKKTDYKTNSKYNYDLAGIKSNKEMLVNSLKLPKDTFLGIPILTITGSCEIWLENYKGILEYTAEQILLQAKTCQICIEGKNLSIDYYTNEDMKISGCILCIRYL